MTNAMICFTCNIELGFVLCSGYEIFLSKGQIKILENKERARQLLTKLKFHSVGKIISICPFASL